MNLSEAKDAAAAFSAVVVSRRSVRDIRIKATLHHFAEENPQLNPTGGSVKRRLLCI